MSPDRRRAMHCLMESMAREDVSAWADRTVEAHDVMFYIGDDQFECGAGMFRVLLCTDPRNNISRWTYDHLDPLWDLEMIDPSPWFSEELLRLTAISGFYDDQPNYYAHGPSYHLADDGTLTCSASPITQTDGSPLIISPFLLAARHTEGRP